eukprot:5251423-Prorocentrum_lima.AAC.1
MERHLLESTLVGVFFGGFCQLRRQCGDAHARAPLHRSLLPLRTAENGHHCSMHLVNRGSERLPHYYQR